MPWALIEPQELDDTHDTYATDEREETATDAPAGLVSLASRERRELHETAVCVDHNTVSRDVADRCIPPSLITDPGRGNPPGAMGG